MTAMTGTSAMASSPEFIRRQYEFAAHIRDPENKPAPSDVEDRRMAIYRELFYNNVEGFLSNTFPVLRDIHDDTRWHAMVRDFFSHHLSQTPLFLEIPREFLAWLENGREQQDGDLPFLYELAHYEWVELAVSVSEESCEQENLDQDGDLFSGIPVLSPLAWHLSYHFPVHEIGPDYQPTHPGETDTCLIVYRNRSDDMGFMLINAVTKRLLELIAEDNNETGDQLLNRVANEMSHPQPGVVVNGGMEILRELAEKDIILGIKKH
jgi:hypothetical protein